jgi:hypothetical protein
MLKALAAALALAVPFAAAARAAEPPKTSEECLKAAVDLAERTEKKQLPDEKQAKVEALLTKVEGYCDASQFAEAATAFAEIETELGP